MATLKALFAILASTCIFMGARAADFKNLAMFSPFITQINDECPNSHLKFWLYTKGNEINPYLLNESDTNTIQNAQFTDAPIKILVHGMGGNRETQVNEEIRSEYLQLNYNVITMDYGEVSGSAPTYQIAVENARILGTCLANFIHTLIKSRNVNIEHIHVLGFSLGAHIAGKAGKELTKDYGMTLSRITGLDPAGPEFKAASENRLSSSSAKFVDVVHTSHFYGLLEPSGHADFYMNTVGHQPSCSLRRGVIWNPFVIIADMVSNVLSHVEETMSQLNVIGCSHLMALNYYAESIRDGDLTFCGKSPSGNAVMGEHVPHTARGNYTVITKNKSPFAADHDC